MIAVALLFLFLFIIDKEHSDWWLPLASISTAAAILLAFGGLFV